MTLQNNAALFSPVSLGKLDLPNRVIMAPLTRARTEADHVPTAMMAEYYAQRASAGLIIAEATMAMEGCSSFIAEPGIYSDAQIAGWRLVTDAVHQKGGKIILQLWHGGRTCHPELNGGRVPVAPSALAVTTDQVHTPTGVKPYTVPRELEDNEIPAIIAGFRQAAINAKAAGFDGVEVHGANGYLLDQFLRDGSNQRSGPYGGSVENRAKLLLDVLEAVVDVWDSELVGLRTSLLNSFNDMRDSDPVGVTAWLAQNLNRFNLAYWHIVRGDQINEQIADIVTPARAHYQGRIVSNLGYDAGEAVRAINTDMIDAVAFGMPYIANPDLVERYGQDAELNEVNLKTLYTPGPEGYTDYPFMTA